MTFTPLEVVSVTGVVTGHAPMEDWLTLRFQTGLPQEQTYALTYGQARELIDALQRALAEAATESRRGS